MPYNALYGRFLALTSVLSVVHNFTFNVIFVPLFHQNFAIVSQIMATFHIEVSGHKKIDGTYAIYIRMTHRQKLKRMKTSLVAFPSDLTKEHKLKEGNLKRKCEMLIHDLYDAQNKTSLYGGLAGGVVIGAGVVGLIIYIRKRRREKRQSGNQ